MSKQAESVEQLFLEHLSDIKSVVLFVGRRRRLTAHELEEFASHVNLKLIEDDYAVLRKFQGRSSLRSYLSVVIQRLYLDWRVAQWGKWRPSNFAKRNGKIAVLLEQLTVCQGLSLDEAQTMLETVHGVRIRRSALESLYARFPARTRRRRTSDHALDAVAASYGDPATDLMAETEREHAAEVMRTLWAELVLLAPDDLRLIKLKFVDGLTIATIAKATCDDAKRLYRRLARILSDLRARLVGRGIRQADVLSLLGRIDQTLTGCWSIVHDSAPEHVADAAAFSPLPALTGGVRHTAFEKAST